MHLREREWTFVVLVSPLLAIFQAVDLLPLKRSIVRFAEILDIHFSTEKVKGMPLVFWGKGGESCGSCSEFFPTRYYTSVISCF